MIENKCFYPLISVIVPIYNAASYLNKCIDSIRNQTYTKLEIILIDDGSNDSSADICDEFAAKDDRIQVVHKSKDRKSTRLNSSHSRASRMPSSA